MIHQYKQGGYNIVLDVCSGAVHVVDEVAYDIIAMFENKDKTEVINRLRYEKPNIQMCFRTEKALSLLHFEGSEML